MKLANCILLVVAGFILFCSGRRPVPKMELVVSSGAIYQNDRMIYCLMKSEDRMQAYVKLRKSGEWHLR